MSFRYIISAPQSYTGNLATECDSILKPEKVGEVVVAAEKSIVKIITNYCKVKGYKVKIFVPDFQAWGLQARKVNYDNMVDYADAAIIFTDLESKSMFNLEQSCKAKPIPVKVIKYEKPVKDKKRYVVKSAIHEAIDEAIAADKLNKKQKRKKYAVSLPEWCTERYLQAHKEWFYKKFPAAANDHGYLPTEAPLINDANSMQAFISKFLFWSGHRCTRLNVMGRKINGNYVVSSTRKGTADLSSTIKTHSGIGLSVMWEIKFGNDRPSEYQLAEQKKEIAAGGQYFFIYSIEEFFEYYEFVVNL